MERVCVDAGVDLSVGRGGGVEDHVTGDAAESSPNVRNHEVLDLEAGAGMGRVDGIGDGSCRSSGGAHEVLLFGGRRCPQLLYDAAAQRADAALSQAYARIRGPNVVYTAAGADSLWRTHSCVPCWHSCRHYMFGSTEA